jgi:hypothetical protein
MSEWDEAGGTWTDRSDRTAPADRPPWELVVLDADRGRMMATVHAGGGLSPPGSGKDGIGGAAGAGAGGSGPPEPPLTPLQIWAWDVASATWSKAAEMPGEFAGQEAGWDAERRRAVFFGYDRRQFLTLESDDLGSIDVRPTNRSPFFGQSSPCSNLVYHARRKAFMTLCQDGLWAWTVAAGWQLVDPSHRGAAMPEPLAYDEKRARLVLFSGGKLWEWSDGAGASP